MNDTFDDARVLAQHSAALRRLARGLVSDPNTADDLVQDTWLGALKRWRRRGEATGPGGLRLGVRHRAISAHRRRGAKAIGNTDSLATSVGGPAETAATLERCRVLHEELGALREPYRSTLVARFIDEHSHAAIAEAQGIATDTVRTRITRGLALLREQLDRRFDDGSGGGRGAWMAALAPLAEPERVASGVSTGVLVTTASTIAVIAAVVTTALFGGGATRPSPEIESRTAANTDFAPGKDELVQPGDFGDVARNVTRTAAQAQPATPSDKDPSSSPAKDEPLSISGVVVDQNGSPVPGLAFDATRPPNMTLGNSFGEGAGVTDATGGFEVVLDLEATEESIFNVAFSDSPTREDLREGAWSVHPVGILSRVRAGSSGHVVQIEVDGRPRGRVIGIAPELTPLNSYAGDTLNVWLTATPGAYHAETQYTVQRLAPGSSFAIEGVRPGHYSLLISGQARRPMMRGGVVVRPGETKELEPLAYDQLGQVVFDRVRLLGNDNGKEAPVGISGWLTGDVGHVSKTWIEFGEDVPLGDYPTDLSPGEWTIQWDQRGFAAPTTHIVVRAGATTHTNLEVWRTRNVTVRVQPPADVDPDRLSWGALSYSVADGSGREVMRPRTFVVRNASPSDDSGAYSADISLPVGQSVVVTVTSDGGHKSQVVLSEPEIGTDSSPPTIDMR